MEWEWSCGLALQELLLVSIIIKEKQETVFGREAQKKAVAQGKIPQLMRKLIRVKRKEINGTNFIIFEDEDISRPLYRIKNECKNL